ncbi:hypothetical protein G6F57_008949 [Rhizopus arrhizus]|uniref:AN1-type domain-containing protein n=1 Tax=Rhizopus oryzae TaxID=64495 RepID=A0A9P6WYL2_RHIOR|nr:hypothetical protein G6F23_004529 [Rhizopus arrhizus]KAG1417516.1 hypothetical protein G6F58_005482 [Rhizopus delemar]KAG0755218.1 hypothetical protein G6F24_011975 [Rhizopus arrhizus]KAG0785998.1 hypothetical protein G6F21_008898 [Rhizopus arrhizus]KAG0799037.1 hypothetical protein G6F22_003628 [Rhizopus arrhizus]
MENNKSPKVPILCTAGCGFYEAANKKENIKEQEELRIEESSNVRKHLRTPSPEPRDISSVTTPTPSTPSVTSTDSPKSDNKLGQTNKGKCFSCRKKVPLAKQAANKCRCGFVFCDTHKYPNEHDCEIDYAKMDREILAKNNPKLHERPKGGRSFQRIDSI